MNMKKIRYGCILACVGMLMMACMPEGPGRPGNDWWPSGGDDGWITGPGGSVGHPIGVGMKTSDWSFVYQDTIVPPGNPMTQGNYVIQGLLLARTLREADGVYPCVVSLQEIEDMRNCYFMYEDVKPIRFSSKALEGLHIGDTVAVTVKSTRKMQDWWMSRCFAVQFEKVELLSAFKK